MANEDRPIIVSGANKMVTITLPPATIPATGRQTLKPLAANGPFKTIVFTSEEGEVEFKMTAAGNWRITIE